jgi:CheY-like chemotaxis protein
MEKLLIVENDRESREALVDLLKADGRSIVTAGNGKEALDQVGSFCTNKNRVLNQAAFQ